MGKVMWVFVLNALNLRDRLCCWFYFVVFDRCCPMNKQVKCISKAQVEYRYMEIANEQKSKYLPVKADVFWTSYILSFRYPR